ncbi:hypothetical protein ACLWBD_06225 [Bdellovibrio sp. HCB117]|uniref:hypothetical protein n=1 Tax=Bdellovibrio sp. HCB117 TaxID=3394359 RepID=UPI0039B61C5D
MKSFLFLTTFFFLSLSAARSTEFGNGGKGIVCPAAKTVQFYDTYESVQRYVLIPYLKDMNLSVCHIPEVEGWEILVPCLSKSIDLALESLQRVKPFDPVFVTELERLLHRFVTEAQFIDGELFPTTDAGIGFIPQGCELKQLAVQHVSQFKNDSSYFISKPLWTQLSIADRVALLIHEVVYKRALQITPNISSSENVRYYSSYILSTSALTRQKYAQIKKILLEK